MSKERLLPLTGALFVVLLILSFVVAGEPPEADSDVQEIVDHYVDNDTAIWIGAGIFMASAVSLLLFASYLRKRFTEATAEQSILPGLVLVGASILAVGGAIDTTITIALAEAAEDIDPIAVQALQALWDNDFVPIALGVLVFILAAGVSTLKTGVLPKWLGWIAIVLAILAFTPIGYVTAIGGAIWIVIASILLAVRAGSTPGAATPTTRTTP